MRIALSGMTNAASGKRGSGNGSGAHKCVAGIAMTGAAAGCNLRGDTSGGADGKLMLRATCQRENQDIHRHEMMRGAMAHAKGAVFEAQNITLSLRALRGFFSSSSSLFISRSRLSKARFTAASCAVL